jgi:hypothetical protein
MRGTYLEASGEAQGKGAREKSEGSVSVRADSESLERRPNDGTGTLSWMDDPMPKNFLADVDAVAI